MERFPKNARVCFLGDSITCINEYVSRVVDYYHENYPMDNINFYNCGTSGARSGDILKMFSTDIITYQPTHAILMFGVNDSARDVRANGRSEQLYHALKGCYEDFKDNLHALCQCLREQNVEIILATPIPVDEYSDFSTPTYPGSFALLSAYADHVRTYAKENGYQLVDQFAVFTKHLACGENLYNDDRTHPNELGHYYLAKTILEAQGLNMPPYAPIPTYLDAWRELVESYRSDIITTECLFVGRYDLPADESIGIVREKLKTTEDPYLVRIATQYIQKKPHAERIKADMLCEMEVSLKYRPCKQ